jgi:hypothetical protein
MESQYQLVVGDARSLYRSLRFYLIDQVTGKDNALLFNIHVVCCGMLLAAAQTVLVYSTYERQ